MTACVNKEEAECDVHTISQTTGGFLIMTAGVLAVAFPPFAAVLGTFGVVAELISIFTPGPSKAENALVAAAQEQHLLEEISRVVVSALSNQAIVTSGIAANAYARQVKSVTSNNYRTLHEIQSTNNTKEIDSFVDNFWKETFVLQQPSIQELSEAISDFVQTAGFEGTSKFDPISTWLESINDGSCRFPIWPNIGTCNSNVENAKSTYIGVIRVRN